MHWHSWGDLLAIADFLYDFFRHNEAVGIEFLENVEEARVNEVDEDVRAGDDDTNRRRIRRGHPYSGSSTDSGSAS